MDYLQAITAFQPKCEQESADRAFFLRFAAAQPNCLLRESDLAHFTASAWVVNPAHTRVTSYRYNL